jgi:hypothetical protein
MFQVGSLCACYLAMRGHQVDVYEYRDGKWSANQAVLLGRSEHNSLGKRAPSPAAAEQFASAGVTFVSLQTS